MTSDSSQPDGEEKGMRNQFGEVDTSVLIPLLYSYVFINITVTICIIKIKI